MGVRVNGVRKRVIVVRFVVSFVSSLNNIIITPDTRTGYASWSHEAQVNPSLCGICRNWTVQICTSTSVVGMRNPLKYNENEHEFCEYVIWRVHRRRIKAARRNGFRNNAIDRSMRGSNSVRTASLNCKQQLCTTAFFYCLFRIYIYIVLARLGSVHSFIRFFPSPRGVFIFNCTFFVFFISTTSSSTHTHTHTRELSPCADNANEIKKLMKKWKGKSYMFNLQQQKKPDVVDWVKNFHFLPYTTMGRWYCNKRFSIKTRMMSCVAREPTVCAMHCRSSVSVSNSPRLTATHTHFHLSPKTNKHAFAKWIWHKKNPDNDSHESDFKWT